jgi:hypothetical protein
LSSKELEKKECWARAIGWSIRSTQIPRGWRRLPLQETIGRVVQGVLWILMVPYRTGKGSSSLSSLSRCCRNCRSFFLECFHIVQSNQQLVFKVVVQIQITVGPRGTGKCWSCSSDPERFWKYI